MIHRLIPYLIGFLQHPVIELRMSSSDEVAQLRAELEAVTEKNRELQHDLKILRSKYVMLSELNLSYVDLLNQHGIKHRHLRG